MAGASGPAAAPGRIARSFETTRAAGRGAFVPYLTSGFPTLAESDRLAAALCEEGADVLELGVPFSDPLADGPIIQRTTQAALAEGTTLAHVLGQALRLRSRHATPIVLMTYLNPIVRYGIDTIALVAPTTHPSRIATIVARARGFLYVVARLGVTGGGSGDSGVADLLDRCGKATPLPRCLGFGMTSETDLAPYRGRAEGIVAGSALLAPLWDSWQTDRAVGERRRESGLREAARRFRRNLEGWRRS
jgi:tryptophan synthase alpha chain